MAAGEALNVFLQLRTADSARASAGEGVAAYHRLADALDEVVRACAGSAVGSGLAFVALGGYGRREQSRHSRIELLLLHGDSVEDAPRSLLAPMRDAGLDVAYSIRS